MHSLSSATWSDIELVRARLSERAANASSVQDVAQGFAGDMATSFSSIALARVFIVQGLDELPAEEQQAARAAAGSFALDPTTRVLSLLGTFGLEKAWCDRRQSKGHRSIPLTSSTAVRDIPMVAKLLADLGADITALDLAGSGIGTRFLAGGRGGVFFVADAESAVDARGRRVIAASDFVARYGIRTVFGMGGVYGDGTLAVSLFFTNERLERLNVDRFGNLITSFKIVTAELVERGRIYA
jgi:hypothetical protein